MVIGVTMVKVVPGQEKAVYNALQAIDGIKDVYHVFGEFDFVVIIEVEGLSMLNKLVDVIRKIDNVTPTRSALSSRRRWRPGNCRPPGGRRCPWRRPAPARQVRVSYRRLPRRRC